MDNLPSSKTKGVEYTAETNSQIIHFPYAWKLIPKYINLLPVSIASETELILDEEKEQKSCFSGSMEL